MIGSSPIALQVNETLDPSLVVTLTCFSLKLAGTGSFMGVWWE